MHDRPVTKDLLSIPFLAMLALSAALSPQAAGDSLFPDANLEKAVRQQVFAKRNSDAPLVEADVANISTVEGRNRGISSLTGLEKCRSLAMLDLAGNLVSDLGPIAGLPRLQFLDVQSNRIDNLAPLAQIPALQYLHLANNQVSEITTLAGLTNLSALYLSGNHVEDLAPLAGLVRLASLYLDHNRVASLHGIEALKGLSSLSLSNNRIDDLKLLGTLQSVQYLFLEKNRIQDLAPLVAWVQADHDQRFAPYLNLYLAGNPLSSTARSEQISELEKAGVRVHR